MFLEELNHLKDRVKSLQDEAAKLPEEIQEAATQSLELVQEELAKAGTFVEEYFLNEEAVENMEQEMLIRLNQSNLHSSIPQDKKKEIANHIVIRTGLNIVDEQELRKYVTDQLRDLEADDLIRRAYTKEELIRVGSGVQTGSDELKYRAGMDIARDLAEYPAGLAELLSKAEEKVFGDPKEIQKYLYQYYGV